MRCFDNCPSALPPQMGERSRPLQQFKTEAKLPRYTESASAFTLESTGAHACTNLPSCSTWGTTQIIYPVDYLLINVQRKMSEQVAETRRPRAWQLSRHLYILKGSICYKPVLRNLQFPLFITIRPSRQEDTTAHHFRVYSFGYFEFSSWFLELCMQLHRN